MGLCQNREEQRRHRGFSRTKKRRQSPTKEKNMSEKELRDIVLSCFDKYDTSNYGTLDLNELTNFFQDVLERKNAQGKHDPKDLAHKLMCTVDVNGDGKISRQELY